MAASRLAAWYAARAGLVGNVGQAVKRNGKAKAVAAMGFTPERMNAWLAAGGPVVSYQPETSIYRGDLVKPQRQPARRKGKGGKR